MLNGQVALVTGAGRGIGRAIALALAKNGADIVISDIMKESVDEAVKEVEALGRKALGILGDVSKFADCEAMVNAGKDAFGKIDILVNNAGITRDNLIMRMSEEDWDAVIAVNLKSVFNCCKAVCRLMMKQKGGRIINISSVVGLMGNAGQANYSASKAGIIGLTKTLAKEFASRGILVNAIAPGFIRTKMTDFLNDEQRAALMKLIPLEKMGEPEDVANAVLFLASPLSSYITGQVIPVDGGMAI
ncbi:MAG TPA: 3-oxoacyl-[acyl-carrier-protein] reductase [Candidatus Sumerlaeota bacterium]|nr:MAG: 3-oxoacyl-(acyl-carrier-protein) reductase FabG [candidate division BRC1 bacterium ADurb.Bin183]HOE63633.1 3-oxoacyl-[acyl-carrier-protein] reductase [Candidatus Sumerlaeota bacterium]HRR30859.1 3-oxoacyl-[acyl-carrier-protein] reductase [Candidatus Sumerlaeia bacterium]HON50529.1 3-oxoacyl-[acyl-carrier-protein] reductase [Candidatus Sumerlaeota bacterium]HOR63744.1 3-oxoacyl-[acyl-carrier-protein] reductase [Candidatus Sumerlaeota bacterium]